MLGHFNHRAVRRQHVKVQCNLAQVPPTGRGHYIKHVRTLCTGVHVRHLGANRRPDLETARARAIAVLSPTELAAARSGGLYVGNIDELALGEDVYDRGTLGFDDDAEVAALGGIDIETEYASGVLAFVVDDSVTLYRAGTDAGGVRGDGAAKSFAGAALAVDTIHH